MTAAIQAEKSLVALGERQVELVAEVTQDQKEFEQAKRRYATKLAEIDGTIKRAQEHHIAQVAAARAAWDEVKAELVETENQKRAEHAEKMDKLNGLIDVKHGELAVAQSDLDAVKEKLDALRETVRRTG